MKQVVCNTKFKLDPFGDGGSKRSVQIRSLLEENGLSYVDDSFVLPKGAPKRQLIHWVFRAMNFVRKHYPKSKIGSLSNYIRLVKYYALRIPIVYDKYLHKDVVFLWEDTNDRDMLYLLKATGCPVVGLPHNIESLVSHHRVDALDDEVSNLQHCDYVFAISKEETWLLRLLGVNARYLPYYPPKEAEVLLLQIRKEREARSTNGKRMYLLLGSATNPPTKKGMQALVDYASSRTLPFDLCVAGYYTESLRTHNHTGVSFLGALTNDELKKKLVEADAVLVYQPPTTGALTRIPEMLVAGLPVYVNFDAARDCHRIDDVHQYETFDALFDSLQAFNPYQAELFERDIKSEQMFINILKSFLHE